MHVVSTGKSYIYFFFQFKIISYFKLLQVTSSQSKCYVMSLSCYVMSM